MFETLAAGRRSLSINTRVCALGLAIAQLVSMVSQVSADDKSDAARAEALAARRHDLMQKRVAAAEIQSREKGFPKQFASKPIFKYSDPARGYVAAAVWKLGDEGRPLALLTSELDRSSRGKPCISFEYSSLTQTPFSLLSTDIRWSPSATLYEFKPLRNAPAPHESATRRLTQMRELAKRFASQEIVDKEKCELRLLPQPVDRYTPSDEKRADGAIFFFTFGTNPEVVLLIESDGKSWSYAAGRMTGADVVVLTLDDVTVWEGSPLQKGNDSPFTGSVTPIDIPGVAPDGSELQE